MTKIISSPLSGVYTEWKILWSLGQLGDKHTIHTHAYMVNIQSIITKLTLSSIDNGAPFSTSNLTVSNFPLFAA